MEPLLEVYGSVCELLGGVMTGGYTIEPSHFRSHRTIVNSMTAIIIDPAYLGGSAAELKDEATRLCDYVKASPARDPKAPYAPTHPRPTPTLCASVLLSAADAINWAGPDARHLAY